MVSKIFIMCKEQNYRIGNAYTRPCIQKELHKHSINHWLNFLAVRFLQEGTVCMLRVVAHS